MAVIWVPWVTRNAICFKDEPLHISLMFWKVGMAIKEVALFRVGSMRNSEHWDGYLI